jgi:hypothetical protein
VKGFETPKMESCKYPVSETGGLTFGKKDQDEPPLTSFRELFRDFTTPTSRLTTGQQFPINSARTETMGPIESDQEIREKFKCIFEILGHYKVTPDYFWSEECDSGEICALRSRFLQDMTCLRICKETFTSIDYLSKEQGSTTHACIELDAIHQSLKDEFLRDAAKIIQDYQNFYPEFDTEVPFTEANTILLGNRLANSITHFLEVYFFSHWLTNRDLLFRRSNISKVKLLEC